MKQPRPLEELTAQLEKLTDPLDPQGAAELLLYLTAWLPYLNHQAAQARLQRKIRFALEFRKAKSETNDKGKGPSDRLAEAVALEAVREVAQEEAKWAALRDAVHEACENLRALLYYWRAEARNLNEEV